MSEKSKKFKELAEKRTNNALGAIMRIGNLSNKNFYEWQDADIKKIVKALTSAVSDVQSKFNAPKNRPDKFRL